jgi:hypothetical protein
MLIEAKMEFVRQIVNSNTLEPGLTLSASFYDVQVEVIMLSVDNREASLTVPSSFSGLEFSSENNSIASTMRSSPPGLSLMSVKHSAFV